MKMPILNRKRRGEVAEAAFLHKAASLGFSVAKPWGESDRYDFIVETGGSFLRVQVKSAYSPGEFGGYTFHNHGNTPPMSTLPTTSTFSLPTSSPRTSGTFSPSRSSPTPAPPKSFPAAAAACPATKNTAKPGP
jgi:hypothetical protein